ncbi:MAG: tRNA (adenosine(37)-N6)-threonylcarbamoyltransferase complex dimerization subunit type 1 TsaB [candidate division WOR-3 bacterium]
MSYFLGIETSGMETGVCLLKEETEFLILKSAAEGKHQENLFLLLKDLFSHFRIQPSDLTGIGVTIGPGMFTSLRVGLAAAKALSLPHKIPIKGIDTFLGLTQTFYNLFPEEEETIIPVIDAKRNQVYAQVYKRKEKNSEPLLTFPEEIVKRYPDAIFFGSGIKSYPQVFLPAKRANLFFPLPEVICQLAKEAITRGEIDDPSELVPFYIKEPDIRV